MIETLLVIEGIFAIMFLLQLWLLNMSRKKQLADIEERMTKNMINAIEKLEWGEEDARTEEKDKQ